MLNFFQKFRDFVAHPTHSRTMGILIFFVLLAAVSLTVIVSQQKQTIRQRASADDCTNIATMDECPREVIAGNTCTTDQTYRCKIGNDVYGCAEDVQRNNDNELYDLYGL